MKKFKNNKVQPIKKFAEEIQIVNKPSADAFKIEFRGTEDVIIEGCMGVIEYGETRITLNLGKRTVSFSGADLEIESFFDGFVTLTGVIISVEFSS